MHYTVDENNCLWIFESATAETAFIKQPHWPDSTPWAAGEAEAWAEACIANLADPTKDLAGNNPSQPTVPVEVNPDPPIQGLTKTMLQELIAEAVAAATKS